jgi:hypothetical protein
MRVQVTHQHNARIGTGSHNIGAGNTGLSFCRFLLGSQFSVPALKYQLYTFITALPTLFQTIFKAPSVNTSFTRSESISAWPWLGGSRNGVEVQHEGSKAGQQTIRKPVLAQQF